MSKKSGFYIAREIRYCICGCGETFECKINSKRKYSKSSHTNKAHNSFTCKCCFCEAKRGAHIPWNKGLISKTDKRVKLISEKRTKNTVYKKGKIILYMGESVLI